ncbi:hypothetical protein ACEUZ9_005455 [Paracoccus litorisediminis]|uniref:hypothetical protein n=1 Tax=Paracoccus litorisediminis TaxID=2006130 RepID=UPI003730E9C0
MLIRGATRSIHILSRGSNCCGTIVSAQHFADFLASSSPELPVPPIVEPRLNQCRAEMLRAIYQVEPRLNLSQNYLLTRCSGLPEQADPGRVVER